MRAALALLLSSAMVVAGCATRKSSVYGGLYRSPPSVILESITESKDSPARGYPVSPFPTPIYPFELSRAGIAGEVTVRLVVGKDGAVEQASIVKSTQKEFEAPVLFAVKNWKFRENAEVPPVGAKGLVLDCIFKFSLDEI